MQIQLLDNFRVNSLSNLNQQTIQLSSINPQIAQVITKLTAQPYHTLSTLQASIQKNPLLSYFAFIYIHPFSIRSFIWNIITIISIYILQLQISLQLGFGPDFVDGQLSNTSFFIYFYYSLILILIVDIFFSFHKGFYAFGKGKVIDNPKQIVINYCKFQFWIDILNISIMIIIVPTNHFYLNFLQLIPACLLWIKKFKYQQQITQFLQYKKYTRIVFILAILAIDVIMIGNFGACIFVGLDILLWKLQYYGNNCAYYWLCNDSQYSINLIDGPWGLQYTYAQSFSSGTLSTLAPGPFGKNPIQICYAIIVMTFFMFLASYVGQVLVSILYYDSQKRVFHQTNIQKFDQFMTIKQVSQQIKDRIHNFFQLIWQVEVKMDTQIKDQVINKLPINLKQKLIHQMSFAKNINILKYFPNSSSIQVFVSKKISQLIVDRQTCIFTSGNNDYSTNARALYFIKEGLAQFFVQTSTHQKQKLLSLSNMQKLLGTYEFVTGISFEVCCKAIDLCTVDRLLYDDFFEIIKNNALEEYLYQLKEEVLIEKSFIKINKKCIICLQQHRQTQCNRLMIKYQIINSLKQLKYNYSKQRMEFKRKSIKSHKIIGKGYHNETKKEKEKEKQQQKLAQAFQLFAKFSSVTQTIFSFINHQDIIDEVYIFEKYRIRSNINSSKIQNVLQ